MIHNPESKQNRICFINPPGPENLYRGIVCAYVSKANYLWQPHDFINLSAQIPEDYDLKFIDCTINNYNSDWVFKKLTLFKPSLCVIAISSIIFEDDLLFLKTLRAKFSSMKCLVLGNILLEQVFWDKVLQYCDGLILNSLDIDFARYIRTGKSDSKNLIFNGALEIRSGALPEKPKAKKVSIGLPRHKIFLNKKYRFPFIKSYLYSAVSTQFGCPFKCGYCSWAKVPVSYRDYQEVLQEIEAISRLGVKDIFFADPSFGFPRDNAISILEGIIKKSLHIRWSCYANPLLLDRDTLALMKKAGCHTVIIGIDDEDADMLKNNYYRDVPKEKLVCFCRECNNLGIDICGDFIIGLRGGKNSVLGMLKLAKALKLDYASFNIFAVLVGSIVREELIRDGKFNPAGVSADPSGNFGAIDEELVFLRDSAVKAFYLRPGYLFRRIAKIRSGSEFLVQIEEMIEMLRTIFRSRPDKRDSKRRQSQACYRGV